MVNGCLPVLQEGLTMKNLKHSHLKPGGVIRKKKKNAMKVNLSESSVGKIPQDEDISDKIIGNHVQKSKEGASLSKRKPSKRSLSADSEDLSSKAETHRGSAKLKKKKSESIPLIGIQKLTKKQKQKLKKKTVLKRPTAGTSVGNAAGSMGQAETSGGAEDDSDKKNVSGGAEDDSDKKNMGEGIAVLNFLDIASNEKKKKKKKKHLKLETASEVDPEVLNATEPSPSQAKERGSLDAGSSMKKKKRKKKKKSELQKTAAIVESEDIEKEGTIIPKKKKKKVLDHSSSKAESTEGSLNKSTPCHVQDIEKFKDILEKLADILDTQEARKLINEEVSAGRIEQGEFMTVLQKWRQQKRKKIQTAQREKVVGMEETLDDVKRAVNDLVRRNKLKPWEAADIIKRWKNRERRRVDRQLSKQTKRACFHCRQQGHVLADCPNRDDDEQAVGNVMGSHGDGICFKCGSTEHSVHSCPRKHVKGFPFATCFVCKQQGHLSRDCEQNAHGIYPDGGCCNVCGSTRHLKRDCPELAAQKQRKDEKKVKVRTMSAMSSADMDNISEDEAPNEEMKAKPKRKIVKF